MVMLVRPRQSRIYCLRRFFDYPDHAQRGHAAETRASANDQDRDRVTCAARCFRSGRRAYARTVFYQSLRPGTVSDVFQVRTRRRCGACPATEISAEWGAQRIKGLSIWKTLQHAFGRSFRRRSRGDLAQKSTQTSLIEQFLYPKFGPGQMWEEVSRQNPEMGGEIRYSPES